MYTLFDMPLTIEAEFDKLWAEFNRQFSDDEDVPDDAYDKYCHEKGSKELIAYMNKCDQMMAEAASRGCIY